MDYELIKRVRDSEGFGAGMGLVHTVVEKGHAEAELPIKPEFINLQGSIHGGVLLTLADVTGGTAGCSYGKVVATVCSDFHFLRAGMNVKKLVAKTREIKSGRTLLVYDVTVCDQDGLLLAEGTFTYMPLDIEIK